MLTHSFEDLTQSIRVLMESGMKLPNLIKIDRPEAIGSLETAINSTLNAYHSLYDLMNSELGSPIDWYATQELSVILAIRNARHHNKANRIRSLYNFHLQTCDAATDHRKYLYVKFPAEGEGYILDVPISWLDLSTFLNLPREESRMRPASCELIRTYINSTEFEDYTSGKNIDDQYIFINLAPLFLNAGIELFPYIKQHIELESVEAKSFADIFETFTPADTQYHQYIEYDFFLPA